MLRPGYPHNKMPERKEQTPEWLQFLLIIGGSILLGYLISRLFDYLFSSWEEDEVRPRIFISHSWRYDNDYWKLIKNFGNNDFQFYNHSIDIEKQLNVTTTGEIEEGIRNKIRGCSKVLVLAGPYADRYWIKKEIEIAEQMGKEVIAIRPWGEVNVPSFLKNKADRIVGFNSKAIIERIKN